LFYCYAQRGTLPVAAPFMMKELGMNAASMGILLSAFFWSYSLAQVPAGWLIDRYGVGRVYAAGFFIWTVAVALTGLASTMAWLIGMRMLLGIGQGVPFPASAQAVANWFPPGERGGATGVYLSGNRLGQAAIGALGPALIGVYGWRQFFLFAGIAGFFWLVIWLSSIRWLESSQDALSPAARARPSRPSLKQFLEMLRDPRIAGIFLGYFGYDYAWFLFVTWMPGYLMLERKFSPQEMAFYSSVPFLAVAVVIILAGILGDSLVRSGLNEVTVRKSLITAGMLVACLIVPAGIVKDNAVSAWLLAIAICGLGITAPNGWVLTQAICPKPLVATASGIQNFGGNLAGVVAPALTGFIAHTTGSFVLAFAIAGVMLLLSIACYWLLIPKRPSDGLGESPAQIAVETIPS
jgi:MFS family permease